MPSPGKSVPVRSGEARPGNFHAEMLLSDERQRSRLLERGLSEAWARDPDHFRVSDLIDRVEVDW